jgi:UDP-N-acetyl-D-glucosamine/UDP-N-acetyl-D-galactosamine dehydrogenase
MSGLKPHYKIAVIGLGYVGLPLARLFATKYPVLGFDLKASRISEILKGYDATLEISKEALQGVIKPNNSDKNGLWVTNNQEHLSWANVFIVTVPTPVNDNNEPDFSALEAASKTVGQNMAQGAIVIYESTVYPGATEEICLPILEQESGLSFNNEFYLGYSPERINPGDKNHRIEDIIKVTSGSNPEIAQEIDALYGSVITAGTHRAESIQVAEAAKVIENAQRDINIAFVNELKQIFDKMNLNTAQVLAAAKTKWNFLDFYPGLVGGHCIGVDPYYLAHKAKAIGHEPKVILSGREVNDSMAAYHGERIIQKLKDNGIDPKGAKILVLGVTFKPNVPDLRNSKVIDLVYYLKERCGNLDIIDPLVDGIAFEEIYGLTLSSLETAQLNSYDCVICAVKHSVFDDLKINSKMDYRW